MSGFKISSELLIGGSSDLDAVFLPVNLDNNHNSSHNHHSHSSYHNHHNHHNTTTATTTTNSSNSSSTASRMTCDPGLPSSSWDGNNHHDNNNHHYHNNVNHHHHSSSNTSGMGNHAITANNNHFHSYNHISYGGQGGEDQKKVLETTVLLAETEGDDGGEADGALRGKETRSSSLLVNAIITDQPDSTDWCYRTSLTSIGVIVVVILFVVFGFDYVHQLLEWLEGVEPWQGVLVLMGLFCVVAFPMAWGLSLMMIACGYLYGILYGPLVVALCMTVCLIVSRTVMQSLCARSLRARFFSPRVEAMVNVVSGKHGMKVVALARLTPIPFGLQNALFSLSSMSLTRYLISSVGGFIPMNLLHCYLGSTLRTMQDLMSYDSNHLVGYLIFGGQILLTFVLLWFVVRKARVELKKAMDESDKSSMDDIIIPNGDCSKTVFVNSHEGL